MATITAEQVPADCVTYMLPLRANRCGRYTAPCFKGGRRYRAGDVDCGTDRDAARQEAIELIRANMR